MYLAVKYLHVSAVVLSVTGFFLRGLLMMTDSPLRQQRWIGIVPHVNDTVLLVAALTLVVLVQQYPFVDAWVTAKVFGLMAYIILGSVALKAGKSKRTRVVAWVAALAVFGYVVSVALTKSAWGFITVLGG